MNNYLADMRVNPHYIILDKFTRRPFDHGQIQDSLSTMKKNLSRRHSAHIQHNEDLWKSLEMTGQFKSFNNKLESLCYGYRIASDAFKARLGASAKGSLDDDLLFSLCSGVQSGLFYKIKHMERLIEWNKSLGNSQAFVGVMKDLEAFEATVKAYVDLVPITNKRYKWEDLKSIQILEVTGVETIEV